MSSDENAPNNVDVPVQEWEGNDVGSLASQWGVPAVRAYRQVGSTNDIARRLGLRGAAAGTSVVADEQVAGRGRAGRSWSSPPGLGLFLSMVARPPRSPAIGALPILVGLDIARSLDHFVAPATVSLKWPNDLLVGDRKLGGILCEASWQGSASGFVVIGVGINVAHQSGDFPDEFRATATSLRLSSAKDPPSRLEVATAILPRLMRRAAGPVELSETDIAEYEGRDALRGRGVVANDPITGSEIARGTETGIEPDGSLLIESEGRILRLQSATVRLLS